MISSTSCHIFDRAPCLKKKDVQGSIGVIESEFSIIFFFFSLRTQLKEEKNRIQREEEERRNRIEFEQFQRKFDKRRNKDRRRLDEPVATPSRRIHLYLFLAVAMAILGTVMAFVWFAQ